MQTFEIQVFIVHCINQIIFLNNKLNEGKYFLYSKHKDKHTTLK